MYCDRCSSWIPVQFVYHFALDHIILCTSVYKSGNHNPLNVLIFTNFVYEVNKIYKGALGNKEHINEQNVNRSFDFHTRPFI